MSCNYAEGLSPYDNKGVLGLPEKFDSSEEITKKINILVEWIKKSKHTVIHTGAGISTSAGIPDFRGPNGVWTLEAKGEKPELSLSFDDAIPTPTHMSLIKLVEEGLVHHIISQNIDGLHLRSGLSRKYISELHGNMYIEQCSNCNKQYIRNTAVPTVGKKTLKKNCPNINKTKPCRGTLYDNILDWDHSLPEDDLEMSDYHSSVADLSICLGTTLQIVPSGNLPLNTKKLGGHVVICNLQPTKWDKKADLIINTYVDDFMIQVMKRLDFEIPKYNPLKDSTKMLVKEIGSNLQWNILKKDITSIKSQYLLKKSLHKKNCGVPLKKHSNEITEIKIKRKRKN